MDTAAEPAIQSLDWVQQMSCLLRQKLQKEEAAWPNGQHVELAIRRSLVRVALWQLAGLVLGRPEFKSSATLVNNQLVASCQLGFLTLLCCV